jgi:predicted PurR-regulated permease PerM
VQSLIGPVTPQRALRWLVVAIAVVAALWFASKIPKTLAIFVVASFVAIGVNPVVARLERHLPRALAIAIAFVGLLAVVVVLAFLVIPATASEIQSLVANAPIYIGAIKDLMLTATDGSRKLLGARIVPPGIGGIEDFISARFADAFSVTLASVGTIVLGTVTVLFIVLSALVLSAFMLIEGEAIAHAIYGAFPRQRQRAVRALCEEIVRTLGEFVAGQTIVCAIVGVAIFAVTLVIGFKFALLAGIVGGILYAIPLFGMIGAQLFALILSAPQGPWMVIWVQVIIFAIARIADSVLVPKIMSESIGVSPIIVMFAVFAGGELFGVPGLLLGIPAAALFKVIWKFFRRFPAVTKPPVQAAEDVVKTG